MAREMLSKFVDLFRRTKPYKFTEPSSYVFKSTTPRQNKIGDGESERIRKI